MHLPFAPLPLALVASAQETSSLGGTTGPDLSRYFAVCAVLILATAAVAWGLRKLVAGNLRQRASGRALRVVDMLPLGGKRKLAVVRCYDRTFVLGLGEREVTPVAELDAGTVEDRASAATSKADDAAFARALEEIQDKLPREEFALRAKAPIAKGSATKQQAAAKPAEGGSRKVLVKRRKSARKQPEASGAALEVADAARRIAADKRKLVPRAKSSSAPAPQPEAAPQHPSAQPRLEGILG